ncbi:Na+/H+ antiporter NhaA [Sphingobium sufflavum]|uniref:Na+/H+ antiporter NhaA n=1 Tax=Sphingobium sufflavum TaxID=1129547 RepID=UPI001F2428E7|nr:Na+/H+ antiporter NhaA [Sphingobium sufflavum]MCE7796012.1 Na+/H+ antiporter NhaA [Sphingobium sufflavum]
MNAPDIAMRPFSMMRAFLATEAAGGMILIVSAVFAMIVANSALSQIYVEALHYHLGGLSLLHWINDGLMALFFLVVGLEIKREVLDGQLSRWSDRVLPGAAAAAGVVAPALIYVLVNRNDAAGLRGWAIPAATDIAFALGVLALLGSRVPSSLKIFLTAVAIIDDLIAVLIIAFFYTADLNLVPLAGAGMGLGILVLCNRFGVRSLWPYLIIGSAIWLCVLQSGIHATLAGVAVAMTVPLTRTPGKPDDQNSPLYRLEHGLHPWVAFLIVPIFGFANAGVSLAGFAPTDALASVPLGVSLGLFLGKQIGIFTAVWLLVRAGWAERPRDAGWRQIYGVALLCGIGFTMSLFIGGLAFGEGSHQNDAAKLGVLLASIISAAAGYVILFTTPNRDNLDLKAAIEKAH